MRLQKYMAKCGVASRRKAEEIILQNRVKINGKIVNELGTIVNTENDIVMVDNKEIKIEQKKVYIVLYKPIGYITTVSDQFDRPSVLDLVKGVDERIYPIGRLDFDSSGLILLTNDGDLTYKLTHPKHEVKKIYIAKIKGKPTTYTLNRFKEGLEIDGYVTAKADIKIIKTYRDASLAEITIHEGRNRQIRKMCDVINHPVISLKRIAMGKIDLGNLEKGKWRYLTDKEVKYLKES